jgi:hypothetical protein
MLAFVNLFERVESAKIAALIREKTLNWVVWVICTAMGPQTL